LERSAISLSTKRDCTMCASAPLVSGRGRCRPHTQQSSALRNSQIDADAINIATDGGKVTLSGSVDFWYERGLAEDMAWSAPGVTDVDDRLAVV
jgi:hypothetical protein